MDELYSPGLLPSEQEDNDEEENHRHHHHHHDEDEDEDEDVIMSNNNPSLVYTTLSQHPSDWKVHDDADDDRKLPANNNSNNNKNSNSNSNSNNSSSYYSYSYSNNKSKQRTVALQAVAENAARAWTTLPTCWQRDKEFILKALSCSSTLPPKSDFERKFSQSLRFDKQVVLAFCHRNDFTELYYQRHLFVPGCWIGDKEVMLAYCQKIPRSLQECTEELCNDRQVVEAAISLGGLELQYASLRLQEDKPIVVQACHSHGRALEYCPPGSNTRQELVQDREFMLQVVLAKPGGGPMWKLAPLALQTTDEELLLQALKHGLLLRDIPKEFATNVDFLKKALIKKSQLYLEMGHQWQRQYELALQAVISPDSTPDIHEKALQYCPQLDQNRQAVLAICQRGSVTFLQELLQRQTNHNFCDDLQVMKLAIGRDCKLFATASQRLQEMPEIILVSITPASAWNTLKTVPWAIQRQHPQIPIQAIQVCLIRNLRYLPSHIPEDLWCNHREVCLAWIRRGGRVLDAFERLLRNNPTTNAPPDLELALEVAKYNWSEFHKVGDTLLADREFMLQALQRDGRVLRFAAPALRQDFDVLVMAVAHHSVNHPSSSANSSISGNNNTNNIRHRIEQLNEQQHHLPLPVPVPVLPAHIPRPPSVTSTFAGICNLQELKRQIQQQLDLHQTFLLDFLRGIAICVTPHIPPPRRSQLPMLDRGVETSQAFKQLIAEYLGVPIGPQLKLLRQAHANLAMSSSLSLSASASAAASASLHRTQMLADWPLQAATALAQRPNANPQNNQNQNNPNPNPNPNPNQHNYRQHPGARMAAHRRRRFLLGDDDNDNSSVSSAEAEDRFLALRHHHYHHNQQQHNQQQQQQQQQQMQQQQRLLLLQEELENDLEMEFLL